MRATPWIGAAAMVLSEMVFGFGGKGVPGHVRPVVHEPPSHPYVVDPPTDRKGIEVNGPWDDRIRDHIAREGIRALVLNSAKGWSGTDYGFLRELDQIEELKILASAGTNVAALEEMRALERLSLTVVTRETVDFTRLANLRQAYVHWWPGARSIVEARGLRSLYLDRVKLPSFSALCGLEALESLTLANASIASIADIECLSGLTRLELLNCRKLADFAGLERFTRLRRLVISGSKALREIDFVSGMRELEMLDISDNGAVATLAPLAKATSLRALAMAGGTNVEDGDLSVLTGLPRLAMLMFAPRRHYTHKLVKPWNWNNFEVPATLLEAK
ncbi:MAG: hypothetical protein H6983_07355 [Ectothiorhodospiraceae bacterium]|nr:hypothetical protein [Ectothiorhodospiraceae bacterium]